MPCLSAKKSWAQHPVTLPDFSRSQTTRRRKSGADKAGPSVGVQHAVEQSPTPIAEDALACRRAKSRSERSTAQTDASVHVMLLRIETHRRRAIPMAPNQAPAESSSQGAADRDVRSKTTRRATVAVAKVLTIALAGVLFLWTQPVLSESVATMDSSRAPQTDGAEMTPCLGTGPAPRPRSVSRSAADDDAATCCHTSRRRVPDMSPARRPHGGRVQCQSPAGSDVGQQHPHGARRT